ncbi:MAG: ParA family protein [Bacteroidota bacterium]
MTKVISFISRKGGTGKTTAAINLATTLHSLKKTVALLETDTNYTLSTLRNIEEEQNSTKQKSFPIYGSDDESVINSIEQFKAENKFDVIVVDSAGKTTNEEIKLLALTSDLIIIPTSLTKNDYLVTYQTVEDLKPAQEHKNELKLLILPNRVHSLTKQETIASALEGLDAEILKTRVSHKNIFANFSTINAEEEFKEIAKEIITHLF